MRLPLFALLASLAAPAGANPPDRLVTLEVLPGWMTADGSRMAGLALTLAPGWKTYWRSPGSAGIPPSFDWTGSDNMTAVALHWPVPQVFHLNGMQSIGYSDRVVIPLELTPSDPAAPMVLQGRIDLGVCEDICVPAEVSFALTLPPDEGRRDPAIVAALVDRPMTAAEAGVAQVTCHATPGETGMVLSAEIALPPMGGDEVVVIESGDPGLWVSEAASDRQGAVLTGRAEVKARDGGAVALDRSALRLTVLADGRAVDIHGCGG
jgi:DsbC/DsbD-like thiol-disulfide interchange protein